MILNYLPISAYSGLLKFDMKMFVNVARLDIGQLFTQSTRGGGGHPCTLDTFPVGFVVLLLIFSYCMGFLALWHQVDGAKKDIGASS